MKTRTPRPQPKRTTVELTRDEVIEALKDYINKNSTQKLPNGEVSVIVDESVDYVDYNYTIIKHHHCVRFIVDEPVE